MFLARTQKQVDGIAAALDEAGIIYKTQDDAVAGASWSTRLRLMSALSVLEGVSPDAADEVDQATSIEDYGGVDTTDSSLGNRALSVEETRTLLGHTNRTYLDSTRSDWQLWLIEHEREAGDTVPLELLTEHVTDKFWSRYNAGKGSIAQLARLSDRDGEAMRAAWDRYDSYNHDASAAETRVLTIHASKGSEASDVVVFDGITKSISSGLEEDADSRENEARTWYVALTRASERVHIVRDAFEYLVPYLPEDLEPAAAKTTEDKLAATDGGEPT
jgi:DNA helicase-2/ATP-dependent DNA helicase PcrA